jgi:ASCH domain
MSGQKKPPPVEAFPEHHRALSVCQPFAEQIMRGEKTIEYRDYKTKIRGMVYLYATKKPRMDSFDDCGFSINEVALGMIVGTVEIVDCTGSGSNFEWHLAEPKRFKVPLKSERQPQPSFWFAF